MMMEPLQNVGLSFKCPVAVGELSPCAGGFYCNGCHKIVRDFRGKTEDEIIAEFTAAGNKLCGMFEADRIKVRQPLWHKWVAGVLFSVGLAGWYEVIVNPSKLIAYSREHTERVGVTTGVIIVNPYLYKNPVKYRFALGDDDIEQWVKREITTDASCRSGRKVLAQIITNKDGSLKHVRILHSQVSDTVTVQILSAIKKSPNSFPLWQNIPGKRKITFPITF